MKLVFEFSGMIHFKVEHICQSEGKGPPQTTLKFQLVSGPELPTVPAPPALIQTHLASNVIIIH